VRRDIMDIELGGKRKKEKKSETNMEG